MCDLTRTKAQPWINDNRSRADRRRSIRSADRPAGAASLSAKIKIYAHARARHRVVRKNLHARAAIAIRPVAVSAPLSRIDRRSGSSSAINGDLAAKRMYSIDRSIDRPAMLSATFYRSTTNETLMEVDGERSRQPRSQQRHAVRWDRDCVDKIIGKKD